MRKVKIPTYMQPYKITINGVTHTFNPGETVEVEDYIAAAIESSKFEPKPAPVRGILWKDITDRPFGEEGTDTLTWDGNTEGLEYVEVDFGDGPFPTFYKISDAVVTLDDVQSGLGAVISNGMTTEVTFEELEAQYAARGMFAALGTYFVPSDNFTLTEDGVQATFPTAGVWSSSPTFAGLYVASITIPGYTGFPSIKKIDEKYLPDNIGGRAVLYAIASGEDKYLYKTNDFSDTANRITKDEFLALYQSRKSLCVELVIDGITIYSQIMMWAKPGDFVVAYVFDGESQLSYHTAEYTG